VSAPEIRGLIHFIIAFFNLFFAFLLWIKGKTKATSINQPQVWIKKWKEKLEGKRVKLNILKAAKGLFILGNNG
jgi:hypothetical protein